MVFGDKNDYITHHDSEQMCGFSMVHGYLL